MNNNYNYKLIKLESLCDLQAETKSQKLSLDETSSIHGGQSDIVIQSNSSVNGETTSYQKIIENGVVVGEMGTPPENFDVSAFLPF